MVFSAAVGPLDEETEDGKTLPKVRVIDRLMYRLDGVGFIYERRQHLFLVDVSGGVPKQLTDDDWDDKDPTWSPDGTRIAFASSRAEDRWRLPCPDIYILSIEGEQTDEDRRPSINVHHSPHDHQDGASAPTQHPHSPRPYARGIEHLLVGENE